MDREEYLDVVFQALSDSKRRKMLSLLAESQQTVSELGQRFGMSKQAISKHLFVLEKAGFIDKLKDGRIRQCLLNPEPLKAVSDYAAEYHRFWEQQFDALEEYIEKGLKEKK